MPRHNLDFSALIPERDTFTTRDGQRYEFRNRADLGVTDAARLHALQQDVQAALAALKLNVADVTAAQTFERAVDELVGIILPELPAPVRQAYSFGEKNAIVTWWRDQQEAPAPAAGEATAGQPA
ncbi:MAG: hypothetical protein IT318_24780 [Anaerolineales bacterium]|nr:hypothetical protein [Anaerolineales bacterium]